MEHDLKRLLAYHSIENIGIILIGLGAALVFRVAGTSAARCGSSDCRDVSHSEPRHLQVSFVPGSGVGAPLDGDAKYGGMGGADPPDCRSQLSVSDRRGRYFWASTAEWIVSEWLTYQSLLAGFGANGGLTPNPVSARRLDARVDGSLGRSLFCEGIRHYFLGLCRVGAKSSPVHEAPRSMLVGMGWLAFSCVALGSRRYLVSPTLRHDDRATAWIKSRHESDYRARMVLSVGTPHGG